MYSTEVIISILFLFLSFSLVIFSLNFQKEGFEDFLENKESLFSSNNCAALIDYSFSNSIQNIKIENCFGNENVVYGKDPKKTSRIITNVVKNIYLEVEINEHYKN